MPGVSTFVDSVGRSQMRCFDWPAPNVGWGEVAQLWNKAYHICQVLSQWSFTKICSWRNWNSVASGSQPLLSRPPMGWILLSLVTWRFLVTGVQQGILERLDISMSLAFHGVTISISRSLLFDSRTQEHKLESKSAWEHAPRHPGIHCRLSMSQWPCHSALHQKHKFQKSIHLMVSPVPSFQVYSGRPLGPHGKLSSFEVHHVHVFAT